MKACIQMCYGKVEVHSKVKQVCGEGKQVWRREHRHVVEGNTCCGERKHVWWKETRVEAEGNRCVVKGNTRAALRNR